MVVTLLGNILFLLLTLGMAWGAAALWYRLLLPAPWRQLTLGLWGLVAVGLVVLGLQGQRLSALGGQLILLAVLLGWWFRLRPTHDRPWAEDVLFLATGSVTGSRLTLDHVRRFEWRTRDEARVRWEARHYDLDRLDSVDMIVSSWGRPAIAHVMVSFGFGGEDFVVFSVEVRRQKGERFSEIGGFFRQYELAIVAADERDAVRLRSNVRGEQVQLFRIAMSRAAMRSLLLAYVEEANRLAETPRFYNTVTANCTTLVFAMVRGIGVGLPHDYRLLLTGKLPDYAFEMGGLWPGYSLGELKRRGGIVEQALAADDDPAFSQRIRRGVPGWEPITLPSDGPT
ncbi:DUF4105 domain-containing protein [Halomonas campisalis]|uniref:DUF4105 domain-containing protein n=1 Tax=Billgrantia campisalis TaxID=74661 RepID=A0ABS9PB43_9GAMM|nr:DUF4105 domain-containing protein [Halomonas campisalis]MCG6658978.1 DUF4105 domain-containing protein [Halomonas campisalis]MDR5863700.1 DUF4105 domain-containing protein [Halomonas campisalis]